MKTSLKRVMSMMLAIVMLALMIPTGLAVTVAADTTSEPAFSALDGVTTFKKTLYVNADTGADSSTDDVYATFAEAVNIVRSDTSANAYYQIKVQTDTAETILPGTVWSNIVVKGEQVNDNGTMRNPQIKLKDAEVVKNVTTSTWLIVQDWYDYDNGGVFKASAEVKFDGVDILMNNDKYVKDGSTKGRLLFSARDGGTVSVENGTVYSADFVACPVVTTGDNNANLNFKNATIKSDTNIFKVNAATGLNLNFFETVNCVAVNGSSSIIIETNSSARANINMYNATVTNVNAGYFIRPNRGTVNINVVGGSVSSKGVTIAAGMSGTIGATTTVTLNNTELSTTAANKVIDIDANGTFNLTATNTTFETGGNADIIANKRAVTTITLNNCIMEAKGQTVAVRHSFTGTTDPDCDTQDILEDNEFNEGKSYVNSSNVWNTDGSNDTSKLNLTINGGFYSNTTAVGNSYQILAAEGHADIVINDGYFVSSAINPIFAVQQPRTNATVSTVNANGVGTYSYSGTNTTPGKCNMTIYGGTFVNSSGESGSYVIRPFRNASTEIYGGTFVNSTGAVLGLGETGSSGYLYTYGGNFIKTGTSGAGIVQHNWNTDTKADKYYYIWGGSFYTALSGDALIFEKQYVDATNEQNPANRVWDKIESNELSGDDLKVDYLTYNASAETDAEKYTTTTFTANKARKVTVADTDTVYADAAGEDGLFGAGAKFQLTDGVTAESASTNLRVIYEVDDSITEKNAEDEDAYKKLGFWVSIYDSNALFNNEVKTSMGDLYAPIVDTDGVTTTLYTSVLESGKPKQAPDGKYYALLDIENIAQADFDTTIYIRAYAVTADDNVIYGDVIAVKVSDHMSASAT